MQELHRSTNGVINKRRGLIRVVVREVSSGETARNRPGATRRKAGCDLGGFIKGRFHQKPTWSDDEYSRREYECRDE